jgi:ribosome-associated translation inhibitor RaiA
MNASQQDLHDAIDVTVTGNVTDEQVDHARTVFARVLRRTHRPVLFVRATLSKVADPAPPRSALVSVRADLNGTVLNAHAAAGSIEEAVGLTADRLRVRLERTPERAHH